MAETLSNAALQGSAESSAPALATFRLATISALLVLIAVAFAPVLGNDLVNWDDGENLLDNPHIRGLSWPQIRWAWSTFWIGVYQPLGWMLFELEYVLFGLRPWGYHLSSVILHAAVCLALLGLIDHLLARCSVADGPRQIATVLGVSLFAVHPLRVEAVAWASCQPYLPCAFFAVLSVVAYLRAYPEGQPESRRWRVAAMAAFVASLLAHATAVGLPLVFLALDFYPLRRLSGGTSVLRIVVEKWPFFLAAAAFSVVGYLAKQSSGSVGEAHPGIAVQLALASHAVFFYPLKTLFPFGLQVHYPLPRDVSLTDPALMLSALGFVAVSGASISLRRRWPGLMTAWVSYLAILLPNLGLVSFGTQLVADRYSYLSSVVWNVVAAYGLSRVPRSRWRTMIATGLVVLMGFTLLTWSQCLTWKDSETLWSRSLRLGGEKDPIVQNNLGKALSRRGRHAEALPHLSEALRLDPEGARSHFNLGTELLKLGRVTEAISRLEAAIRLKPDYAEARDNLAMALSLEGRTQEQIAQLGSVVRLRPDWVKARQRLGMALVEQGQFNEARAHLEIALRQDPGDAFGHVALGRVLAETGRLEEAVDQLKTAVTLRPDSADTHFNLGLVLAAMGRLDEAADQFREALRLRPNDADALRALASLRR